jgi:hypothetical protein
VGTAPEIAAAAAADGAAVEIVTKIGEDGTGEELLLALARAGVGHLAVLRDPSRTTSLAPDEIELPDDDGDHVPTLLAEQEETAARLSPAGMGGAARSTDPEPADLALGLRTCATTAVVAVADRGRGGAAVIAEALPSRTHTSLLSPCRAR